MRSVLVALPTTASELKLVGVGVGVEIASSCIMSTFILDSSASSDPKILLTQLFGEQMQRKESLCLNSFISREVLIDAQQIKSIISRWLTWQSNWLFWGLAEK